MPKRTTKVQVRGWKLAPASPESEPMLVRILGISPDDPARGMIVSQIFRAHKRGEDITDRQVIDRCVTRGRQIVVEEREAMERAERECWIYYIHVGKYIKIGTARDLRSRLASYPPGSDLLALERGSYRKEAERLAEFGEYLAARKEWFTPGPRLMEHIAVIRDDDTLSRFRRDE